MASIKVSALMSLSHSNGFAKLSEKKPRSGGEDWAIAKEYVCSELRKLA